jgi:3-phosphoglycerate kinase
MAEEFEGPKVQDIDTTGLDVLYKVDFNVPLEEKDGAISVGDPSRIVAVKPTGDYFKKNRPKRLVFISHLGKPKGKVVPKMSLEPVAKRASEILGLDIKFIEDYSGGLPEKGCFMLENVRFDRREKEKKNKSKREEYAKELCDLIDPDGIVVFDAFGAAHREHASAYDIMKNRKAYAGFLMQEEIKRLQPFINPGKGSLAILAGAKIEDKIEHVEKFLQKYDHVLLGGGMIFTFYKAEGYEIGASLVNPDMIKKCKELLDKYGTERGNGKLILPLDVVVTKILAKDKKVNKLKRGDYEKPDIVAYNDIKPAQIGLDIGEKTTVEYKQKIASARMIFWNGPMGVFEVSDFENGTKQVGLAVAQSKGKKVAGGGDTLKVLSRYNLKMDSSTGGGASSDLVANDTLPAYEALKGNFN